MTYMTKREIYFNNQLKSASDVFFKLEKRRYTSAVIKFIARYGMTKKYNVKLFKSIVESPEMFSYVDRYDIRNHKDLHKYVQQRLIEYVNHKIVSGK